jgi:hypothetical protein
VKKKEKKNVTIVCFKLIHVPKPLKLSFGSCVVYTCGDIISNLTVFQCISHFFFFFFSSLLFSSSDGLGPENVSLRGNASEVSEQPPPLRHRLQAAALRRHRRQHAATHKRKRLRRKQQERKAPVRRRRRKRRRNKKRLSGSYLWLISKSAVFILSGLFILPLYALVAFSLFLPFFSSSLFFPKFNAGDAPCLGGH